MSIIKPPALHEGDTIGIVSPGSPCTDEQGFNRACSWWEEQGFRIKKASHLNTGEDYLSGTPEQRAEDFNAMVADDSVDAIFAARGGCGSADMVSLIDFDAFAANPKVFMGFSDNTSVHLAITARCNVVTFHGPVMTSFGTENPCEYTCEAALRAVSSTDPIGRIDAHPLGNEILTLSPGGCRGSIIGGNLTRVCGSLGTPYEIDTVGKILLLEEVACEPWIILDCLIHLQNAGKFDDVAGVVIGGGYNNVANCPNPTFPYGSTYEQTLTAFFKEADYPVLYGLPLGHTAEMTTIPLGVSASLDASGKNLTITECGVSE